MAEFCVASGIGYFLPLVQRDRRYEHRVRRTQQPLFPGYLFLFGPVESAYRVQETSRIAQIQPVRDQSLMRRELSAIRRALEAGAVLDLYPKLVAGAVVRILEGSLAGVEGIVERPGRDDRLHLRVTVLGASAVLDVDPSAVVAVESGISPSRTGVQPKAGGLDASVVTNERGDSDVVDGTEAVSARASGPRRPSRR